MINNEEVYQLQRDFAIGRPLYLIHEMQVFMCTSIYLGEARY